MLRNCKYIYFSCPYSEQLEGGLLIHLILFILQYFSLFIILIFFHCLYTNFRMGHSALGLFHFQMLMFICISILITYCSNFSIFNFFQTNLFLEWNIFYHFSLFSYLLYILRFLWFFLKNQYQFFIFTFFYVFILNC